MHIVGCFKVSALLYYGAVIGNPWNFPFSAGGCSSGSGSEVRGGGGGAEGERGVGGGGIGLENVVVGLGVVVRLGEVVTGLESGVMGAVLWVLW